MEGKERGERKRRGEGSGRERRGGARPPNILAWNRPCSKAAALN